MLKPETTIDTLAGMQPRRRVPAQSRKITPEMMEAARPKRWQLRIGGGIMAACVAVAALLIAIGPDNGPPPLIRAMDGPIKIRPASQVDQMLERLSADPEWRRQVDAVALPTQDLLGTLAVQPKPARGI